MKKNVIKMTFAAVCVVAAGVSGMKAYNAANQSEADMLFAENVEALSQNESSDVWCGCITELNCGCVCAGKSYYPAKLVY